MHCFDVGSDCDAVASTYQPHPNKASQFENTGLMVNGTVYSTKTKAAYIADYTSLIGAAKAQTLGDIVSDTGVVADEFYVDNDALQQWKTLKGAKSKERICKNTGHAYIYSEGAVGFPDALGRPSRTTITGEGGAAASRFKHVIRTADGRLRRLVPQELEALNGFPRGFTDVEGMKDAKRAFFMGNALVVGIVAALGRELAQRIESLQRIPANSHPKPEANEATGDEGQFGGSAPGSNALPPPGLLSVCAPALASQ